MLNQAEYINELLAQINTTDKVGADDASEEHY